MSAWHRPDVELAAIEHLTAVVGPVSAPQIVDGLLAKGRADQAAEVAQLRERVAALETALVAAGRSLSPFFGGGNPVADALGARWLRQQAMPNAGDEDAGPLSESQQAMLAFALDLAGDRIASHSNEFTDDDRAALASLRRLAAGGAS